VSTISPQDPQYRWPSVRGQRSPAMIGQRTNSFGEEVTKAIVRPALRRLGILC